MRKLMSRRGMVGLLFVLPAVLYFGLIYFYPLVQSFIMSFQSISFGEARFIGLDGYRSVLSDRVFIQSVKNTLAFTGMSVALTVILALLIAILLNEVSRTWRNILTTIFFLPLVSSLVAAALVWEWLYQPVYGLLNFLLESVGLPGQQWLNSPDTVLISLVIMNVWLRVGFAVIILTASLQSLPTSIFEAARLDGANRFRQIRHLTLPLLNPTIVLVVMIELIFAVKVFDQVYATTQGGPLNASRVVMLYLYETAFQWGRFGEASVVAVLIFLFLLVISVAQWYLARRTTEY